MEDLDTTQTACIIRCVLTKLIGEVRIFPREKAKEMCKEIGSVLFKFGKLVQQSLDMKENGRESSKKQNFVSKEAMVEALETTLCSIQSESFQQDEIDFTILYLFSWSHNP